MDDSLRERKKAATKIAIYEAADSLFNSKGYAKTTLNDIAEAANVSQRTIFSYFPSKEAIIFEKHRAVMISLFDHIDNRENQSVLEAIRSFSIPKEPNEESDKWHALLDSSPELQEYLSQLNTLVEKQLVERIANEKNLSSSSIQAHLIAASCRAVIDYSMNNKSDVAASEIGIKFIEAGLEATTKINK
jgi:AcrR family transcriptional regulator